jgi:uncharacterized membrane protein YhaH (DUF805 family)
MFKNPFSFEGRIRRTEYGLSVIIYAVFENIISRLGSETGGGIILILLIPVIWLLLAQATKRCHDVGNSGWWQLIPLYGLWLVFQDGDHGPNQYGENPKGIGNQDQEDFTQPNQPNDPQGGSQDDYTGEQDSPKIDDSLIENPTNIDGLKDGDLDK